MYRVLCRMTRRNFEVTHFSNSVFGDLDQAYFTQLARGKQAHQPQKRFSAVAEGLYIPKPPLTAIEARRRRGEIFISYKR